MTEPITSEFDQILKEAKKAYHSIQTEADCPTDDMLFDYVYQNLSEDEHRMLLPHLDTCERCMIEILRIETDKIEWEYRLQHDPDDAITDALGSELKNILTDSDSFETSLPSFISKLKDAAIEFITDFWQPFGAGELATAADIPEQKYDFITDHGTIEMSCSWCGEYRNQPAYIRIVWKAHIAADCELVARFVNPETNLIRSEIRLGKYRTGTETITQDELGFDPSNEKWAVAILLVNIEE